MYLPISQVNEITVDRLILAKDSQQKFNCMDFVALARRLMERVCNLRSVNQLREVTAMQQRHNFSGISFLRIHHILEDCGKQVLSL